MFKKSRKKKTVQLILLALVVLVLSACGTKPVPAPSAEIDTKEPVKMRVAALMGPTGMGMVELMEKSEQGEALHDYEFSIMGSPDDLVGRIISGEVDIAAVPTNLASVLYNRTNGGVQLAAVNTLGVLYILEQGEQIQSMQDLKGKTVNVSGKGASPDFTFRYLLEKNGLKPDVDVFLNYSLQHSELAAAAAAGDIEIALLPQPHVTTALLRNEKLRMALDITEEWNRVINNSQLPMGVIIVQKDFADNNKDAFNQFLDEYQQSVGFVNSKQQEAAPLLVKHDILPNEAIALKAIPHSNIVYIDAQEAKVFLQDFYQILYKFEPKSVGGQIANESFYYKR